MSIKGQVQSAELNKFGYPRIKVSGAWYGADSKKGKFDVKEGDFIEIEAFKNDRGYDTFKLLSLRVLPNETAVANSKATPAPANNKDAYWEKKEASDAAKEPRISFYAAYERSVHFVDLALRNGAIGAYAKAKDTSKLEILTALVDEHTQRILSASYAQGAPILDVKTEQPETSEADEGGEEGDSQWK